MLNSYLRPEVEQGDATQAESATEQASGQSSSNWGIIVTKRVGNAVCRNRLRRQMREILRDEANAFAEHRDNVLIMRHSARGASYEQLRDDYRHCQKRSLRKEAAAATPKPSNPAPRS